MSELNVTGEPTFVVPVSKHPEWRVICEWSSVSS
jgi:hypothetical protein